MKIWLISKYRISQVSQNFLKCVDLSLMLCMLYVYVSNSTAYSYNSGSNRTDIKCTDY